MKDTKNTTWKQKLNSSRSLKNEIKWIFSYARKENKSHDYIMERLSEQVYLKSKYTTLPNYIKSEINGYIFANYDMMKDFMEWVHWYNNEFVGKKLPYGENFKQELVKSNHVYKGTQNIY